MTWPQTDALYDCAHGGGPYRVLTIATHAHSGQRLVVYQDAATGEAWCCTLADWTGEVSVKGPGNVVQTLPRFRAREDVPPPVPVQPEAAVPAPERIAGALTVGSGV